MTPNTTIEYDQILSSIDDVDTMKTNIVDALRGVGILSDITIRLKYTDKVAVVPITIHIPQLPINLGDFTPSQGVGRG